MPNSPVVIKGNNHRFEGFVVAEKFVQLKKDLDFPEIANSVDAIKKATICSLTTEEIHITKMTAIRADWID